jgi:hypothetical protein
MSIGDVIKRIFGGAAKPDDESAEQEEFGAPDPGEADLHDRQPEPFRWGAEPVADALDDEFKPPADPAP